MIGNKKFKYQKGQSAVEILVALAVLVISISAVISVVFGGQSITTDAQTNQEALYKAQALLENARASISADFDGVVTLSSLSDDIYSKTLSVLDLNPCEKEATSRVNWAIEGRPQKVEFATYLSDVAEALAIGGDCGIGGPGSDWLYPDTLADTDAEPSGNQATGIDAVNKIVFLSAGVGPGPGSWPDFFIIDARNACSSPCSPPPIISRLDITDEGLNAVDVVKNIGPSGKDYAFVINNRETAPYNQLLVIDVTDIYNPLFVNSASRSLPGVSGSCPYSCPQGRSLFYYQNRLYIGTHRTGGGEFHVFDVSLPDNPIHLGSIELNHNVNAIYVKGTLAYLATSDDTGEVMVIDISNPASMTHPDITGMKYNLPGNYDATSLYLLGSKLYVGRERGNPSNPDFWILDISNPAAISPVGSKLLGLNPNTAVTGIKASGKFVFLATSDSNSGFKVLNVSNPGSPQLWSCYNYSEKSSGIDFESNFIYLSNQSNNALRIIHDNVISQPSRVCN